RTDRSRAAGSDLFPDGSSGPNARARPPRTSGSEDTIAAGRPRQHHEGAPIGQGRRAPDTARVLLSGARDVNPGAIIGLLVMAGSEGATLARVELFYSWNTPICWSGFILFADSVVWRARGDSWLRSAPLEFAFLSIASIPLWLVFEGYNLLIQNWHYVGL